MRIGLVCPYSFDVPGGVQTHVLELARELRHRGHRVAVLAPARHADLPDYVTPAGGALGIPYNGSIARLAFGPRALHRVRRWLRTHRPDLLHLHEPAAPSLSLLALTQAECPVVATFHTSSPAAGNPLLRPLLRRITTRIAVSATARSTPGMIEIPNGVDTTRFARATPLPLPPGALGFLGRYDEPRKGLPVLLAAARHLLPTHPDLNLVIAGTGNPAALHRAAGPALSARITLLGQIDDPTKARLLRGLDLYCAPNLGGESFGMVLTEAMAAGAPVLASDLAAFTEVLGGAGETFPVGDSVALAGKIAMLLADPGQRARLSAAGRIRARRYDWTEVAGQLEAVYRSALAGPDRACPAATISQCAPSRPNTTVPSH
ncbi:glycosyltransferase family 4 protein [Crossiella sp. CA198]|uniref:glycosyltransferase family 4 protein n=1 Tax=Crossiella sp. CA198 TaxID=3455607 RepID=UPI003F8D4A42